MILVLPPKFAFRRPQPRASVLAATVCSLLVVLGLPGAAAAEVGLGQIAGHGGCIWQQDSEESDSDVLKAMADCAVGKGLLGPSDVAVTPDGRNVYVVSGRSGAIVSFRRDGQTGALAELACTSNNGTDGRDGTDGACADGDVLRGASSAALSPDGKFLYVASYAASGLAIFSRDDAGRLTQVGCVRSVSTCTPGPSLSGAIALAISPDGTSLYVAAYDADAIVSFSRDSATGLLKPLGCISDDGTDRLCVKGNALRGPVAVVVSKDGKNVYAAAQDSDSVLTFARDAATGTLAQTGCIMDAAPAGGSCDNGHALSSPAALTFSADGNVLWAAATYSNAIVALNRDRTTGGLREVGCVSEPYEENQNDGCTHTTALSEPNAVAPTPDGKRVLVAVSSGITVFDRDPTTGGLAPAGCLTDADYYDDELRKACTLVHGVADSAALAISPDSRSVYAVSSSYEHNAVTAFAPAVSVTPTASVIKRDTLAVRLSCPRASASVCAGAVTVRNGQPSKVSISRRYALAPGRSKVIRLRVGALLHRSRSSQRPALLIAARDRHGSVRPSIRRLFLTNAAPTDLRQH